MKKHLYLFALVAIAAACQQTTPPVAKVVVKASVSAVALDKAKPDQQAVVPTDMLTPDMLTLLRQFDLSPLWAADTSDAKGSPTMNGFFGDDHRSIAFVFDKVERDAKEPQLFHVRGRERFRKLVTSFEGTLKVHRIVDCDSCDATVPEEYSARAYTASATFNLREDQYKKDSGVFSGEAFLDFLVTDNGIVGTPDVPITGIVIESTPTKGSTRLLRGIWTSTVTGQTKPLLVANDVFIISPEIYSDFGTGDRSSQVNPKYAKLGWDTYWENDEWWAKTPKPSLNL